MNARVPAVVLGTMTGALTHGSVAAVRTLGRLGVPVFVVSDDRGAPAARSRYASGWERLPRDASEDEALGVLSSLAERLGERPVLITTEDVSTVFVDDHADQLEPAYRFPRRPAGVGRLLANKLEMHDLCVREGVGTPDVSVPSSAGELEAFVERATFPIVVKLIEARVSEVADRIPSVSIVQTPDELRARFAPAIDATSPVLMLQEYIPGRPEDVWMFNGYFDADSRCCFGATGRKRRQYPPYTGLTSFGECVPNDEVASTTARLMAALGYRGVIDIGYRFDERDGRYKLLDANPRVGATFRLFAGEGGLDVVRALYLDLTGQPVPSDAVRPGRRWLLEPYDPVSSLAYMRHGELTAREWIASLRGVDELAIFDRRDPAPFAAAIGRLALPRLRRLARAGTRRAADGSRAGTAGDGHNALSNVRSKFDRDAERWDRVYEGSDVVDVIYQQRLQRAIEALTERVDAASGRVLDVGAGAGVLSVALGERGFDVVSADASVAMTERLRARAAANEVRPDLVLADARRLPFGDAAFDAVAALGVLPWLDRPDDAVAEAARVLRPGGTFVVSVDNRTRAVFLLDPWLNPYLDSLRRGVKALVGRRNGTAVRATGHTMGEVRAFLERHGFDEVRTHSIGFGPFTLGRREVLPRPVGMRLQAGLQRVADRNGSRVRLLGSQYLVVATKRDCREA